MKERNEIMRFFGLHPQNDVRRKFAFTLAEVLITLGIIGVVAALTVPTLMQNVTNRQFETGNKVFTNKLKESLKVMNTQQILKGYTTTEAFMDEFKKHYKIANVCVDNPTQCFPKTVTWNDKEVDLSNIKEAKDMVQYGPEEEDWGTKVVGVQFANGVSGLLAYNPKCKADPFNMQAEVLNCLAIVYDLNANATPNEYGKDLMTTANVKTLSSTAMDINGVKVTKIITPDLIAPVNCKDTSSPDYQYCPTEDPTQYENDIWAGAAKACGGRENLPTQAQLDKIYEKFINDIESASSYGVALNFYGGGGAGFQVIGGELEIAPWRGGALGFWYRLISTLHYPTENSMEGRSSSWISNLHVFCVEN